MTIAITKVTIQLGKRTLELTPAEVKALRDELNRLFPEPQPINIWPSYPDPTWTWINTRTNHPPNPFPIGTGLLQIAEPLRPVRFQYRTSPSARQETVGPTPALSSCLYADGGPDPEDLRWG